MEWLIALWLSYFLMGDPMPKKPNHPDKEKVKQAVVAAATASGQGLTCELCENAAWWPANGFSEAERQMICGPGDLDCPGFGENPS